MESGVHSLLHANCHHHITFAKFNICKHLKIHYLLPHEQKLWHYQKANVDQIKKVINEFLWDNCFASVNVNEQAQLFNQTIQNIRSN